MAGVDLGAAFDARDAQRERLVQLRRGVAQQLESDLPGAPVPRDARRPRHGSEVRLSLIHWSSQIP